MALPNTNISTTLVGQTLGTSSRDVGTLCTHPNINMWSRWKPIVYPKVTGLTADEFKAQYRNAETSFNGDFGIRIPEPFQTTNVDFIKATIIDAVANYWEYRKPEGGLYEPFRLGDFRNYYPNAEPFIQCVTPLGGSVSIPASVGRLIVHFDLDPNDSVYNLQATDFSNNGMLDLRNYTFYGVITKYEGGELVSSSESETILASSGEMNAPALIFSDLGSLPQMNKGYEYELYVVLRDKTYNGWRFYCLPNSNIGSQYNKFPIKINIIQNPIEDGGGIENIEENVSFTYAFGGVYKTAGEAFEEFGDSAIMRNRTGEILIKINLKNGSNQAKSYQRNNFSIINYENSNKAYPNWIYDYEPSGAGSSNTVITIPANTTKTIWVYFESILMNAKYPELAFFRDGIEIINGAFNYQYGTPSWINK